MQNRTLVVLLMILGALSALTSGCGKSDGNAPLLNTTELQGAWKNTCYAETDGSSDRSTFTFSGNTATATYDIWRTNGTCTGDIDATVTKTVTFLIGAASTTATGYKNLDFSQLSITMNIKNAATITAYAAAFPAYVTATTALNTEIDIAGTALGNTYPANGTGYYNLYKLDAVASPNTVIMGSDVTNSTADLGATTASARPTTGNVTNSTMIKQ